VVTTLAAGLASPTVPGDDIYIAADHVEPTYTVATTITALGTTALPNRIFVADHTVALGPAALIHTPTVTLSSNTAAANISMAGTVSHCEGIIFSSGTAALQGNVYFNGSWSLKNCSIILNNTATTSIVRPTGLGTSRTIWDNVAVTFGAAAQSLTPQGGEFLWQNTLNAISGTAPSSLFSAASLGITTLRGVDLTAINGKILIPNSHGGVFPLFLIGCKLPASLTNFGTTQTSDGAVLTIERSASSGLNYTKTRETFHGAQTTDTATVRTGSASDGTTASSWKIDTATNRTGRVKPERPFKSSPIVIWNDVINTNRVVTIYGIGSSLPTNKQIWLEVEYMGSSGSPLVTIKSTTIDTPLTTAVPVDTDASTWSGSSTTPFKLVATLSAPQPAMKGPMTIRVCVGAEATYYIDWQPVLS
jgi:hypothetical protein